VSSRSKSLRSTPPDTDLLRDALLDTHNCISFL
jgi:hypothetical protein